MALPRKLKNFNLFADGESYAGVATEVGTAQAQPARWKSCAPAE